MNTAKKIIIATWLLLVAANSGFALTPVEFVTKEAVKAMGVKIRAEARGSDQVWVELEFKPEGKLKTYSRVQLGVFEGKDLLVSATLKEDQYLSKAGNLIFGFFISRSLLDKASLTLFVNDGAEMIGGLLRTNEYCYQLELKDYVPADLLRKTKPASSTDIREALVQGGATTAAVPQAVVSDTPRQVIAEFLRRLKAVGEQKIDAQKVWELSTRSLHVGWDGNLGTFASKECIHPLHQLGNDSQALVLSAPFKDDAGRERIFCAVLVLRDGKWLIDRSDTYRSRSEAENLLDGFLLNPGVKFDVQAIGLVGKWRYPCASTLTLYADVTGVRVEEGPSGVPEKPEHFRWDMSGDTFRAHWPDHTDAAKVTRVTDDGFVIIDAKGQTEGFDYREEAIAPGSPHELVVYDPRLTQQQSHCFGIEVERERMMDEDLTAKLDVADPHLTDASLIAWMKEHRIDAVGRVVLTDGKLAQLGLRTFEMLTIPVAEDMWNKITAAEIAGQMRQRLSEWGAIAVVNDVLTDGKKPATYLFQTRDGSQGLLQILGTAEKNGVKLHYKLVQNTVTTATPVSMPPAAPALQTPPPPAGL